MRPSKAGYFHSVETFGTVDGPGVRYVLFLSGCTLGCSFCHNRDTWSFGAKSVKTEEVLDEYERYRLFYETSGGGLTVSGGEPLLQPEFVAELFQHCRERGIHTALDTAGSCPPGAIEKVLDYADLIMFSIKAGTDMLHRKLTRQGNREIIENLRLAAITVPLVVRYVVIPGVTDTEHELQGLADLVNSLSGEAAVELLPYHQAGRRKWEELNQAYPLAETPAASTADLEQAARLLRQRQITLFGF